MFYLSRTKLLWACGVMAAIIVLLALTGCQTPNPSWGGSRW